MKAVNLPKLGKIKSEQRDKLVRGVLAGKDVRRAALDAGYSETTAKGRIYQIIRTPDMRERFRRIANDAALDLAEPPNKRLTSHTRYYIARDSQFLKDFSQKHSVAVLAPRVKN